ncbi:MAG TPA: metallophosphoesterase [Accumulibacter sp.]|nr:metallophosphoesterase [Accumulibacter sp.]HMW16903.1 metallophosphoesterase [Accumulibacter sp.]HMX23741.1 metallophosphoesterase [Accumulibacter sp.]HMY06445.1 metallophosphoesterase [Accumulibacter sp.]HNC17350.1 metallophosphoesterase [Accumulibacter sp.]
MPTKITRPLRLLTLLTAALLGGAPMAASVTLSEPPLAYVVLGERAHALRGDTVPLLRVILATPQDDACHRLQLVPPNGATLDRPLARANPDVKRFPIAVCEAVLPFADSYQASGETWTAKLDGKTYPLRVPTVVRNPEKFLIVGDMGCRDNKKQHCHDAEWPFYTTLPQDMAKRIAADNKATVLVIVGDFKYRVEKKGGTADKEWQNWQADFFTPMSGGNSGKRKLWSGRRSLENNLLSMAPWVVTRGNHELCNQFSKGGPGWFYLLEPTSPLLGDSDATLAAATCPSDPSAAESIGPAYRLDFAHGFSLLQTDSAAIAESKSANVDQAQALAQTLSRVDQGFRQETNPRLAWWVTHKPVWAAIGSQQPKLSNATLQAALAQLPEGTPPTNVKLIVSGHKHFYQSIEPGAATRQPLQLVVGNGGVLINPQAYNGPLEAIPAEARGASHYGFVEGRLEVVNQRVTGWTLDVYAYPNRPDWGAAAGPQLIQTCRYPASGSACTVVKPSYFTAQPGEDNDPD